MKLNDYEIKHNEYLRKNGAECTVLLKKDGRFPLSAPGKIAIFGSGARNTIKGGTGSGEVNSRFYVTIEEGLKNAGFSITSEKWLEKYGEIIAEAKKQFIKDIKAEAKAKHTQAMWLGMGRVMPEPEYNIPIEGEGDTAIYVLSRISGEGSDREAVQGDILLSETEKRDILACNEKYDRFMLVINAGGVVDLTEVKDVKNILVLSQLGVETGDILADILLGKSNPSGKLATTWSAYIDYPTIGDFGDKNETAYKEGVYVGYRYFDSVGKKADYPFGFGLSYSEFEIEKSSFKIDGSKVSVSAKVKNNGLFEGKEVVQVYVSLPEGKLDQPYQMLAGYAKTNSILPNNEETVTVNIDMADLASYDEASESYILEAGEYIFRVGNSSINTIPCGIVKLDAEVVTLKAKNVLGTPGFKDYVPTDSEKSKRALSEAKRVGVEVLKMAPEAIKTVIPNYDPTYEIDKSLEDLPIDQLIKLNLGAFAPKGGLSSLIGNAGSTVAGAAGQSSLEATQYGIPSLVMADGPAGVRISKKYALDKNGVVHVLGSTLPETIVELMPKAAAFFVKLKSYKVKKTDVIKEQYATAIPIGTAIAQSFNTEFAYRCGDIVGFEMEMFGVHLWLAPALNIHRTIRCGRNFEYYSEDPLVSGECTAAITRGVQQHKGCGTTIKHYAANNQEFNRLRSNSRVSERAMREIYLKGFGIAVKKSQPKSVMTSYNLLNGVHTAEHRGLIEDILRAEYGFEGIVMSDWVVPSLATDKECVHPIAVAPKAVMAGGDLFMPGMQLDYDNIDAALKAGEVTKEQLLINATRTSKMAKELAGK